MGKTNADQKLLPFNTFLHSKQHEAVFTTQCLAFLIVDIPSIHHLLTTTSKFPHRLTPNWANSEPLISLTGWITWRKATQAWENLKSPWKETQTGTEPITLVCR